MLKALSIKQPWAWCILQGYKPVENRTWYCKYRGELFIHAGKKVDWPGYAWIKENFPGLPLPQIKTMQTGGLLGKVDMVDCVDKHSSEWFCGPYGFVFEKPQRIRWIPSRGQLGIFNIDFHKGMRDIIDYGVEKGLFDNKARK